MAALQKEYGFIEVQESGAWKYVRKADARSDVLHLALEGNEKVGARVICFNVSAWYTCNHSCECFSKGKCYACGGCYTYFQNMLQYAENAAYIYSHTAQEIADEIARQMPDGADLFRWHTIGDFIPATFEAAVILARRFKKVHFWAYTKKYRLVNGWIEKHGRESIPENLVIIFSEWRNEDGTVFPMPNPYNLPVSRFIPVGMEKEADRATHVCPCSNPDVLTTCRECDHACHTLKDGESMALLEHSTKASAKRDRVTRAAHKALKEAKKAAKAAERAAKKAAKEAEKAARRKTA